MDKTQPEARATEDFEKFGALADELLSRGFEASIEGGGAACPFIGVTLEDRRVVHFGEANGTWTGDIFASTGDVEEGNSCSGFDTEIDMDETDPVRLANAFVAGIEAREERGA